MRPVLGSLYIQRKGRCRLPFNKRWYLLILFYLKNLARVWKLLKIYTYTSTICYTNNNKLQTQVHNRIKGEKSDNERMPFRRFQYGSFQTVLPTRSARWQSQQRWTRFAVIMSNLKLQKITYDFWYSWFDSTDGCLTNQSTRDQQLTK
jgi:hypothetical protein